MDEITVINGQLQSALDVRDRGLAYGHGVFETIKLSAGELPLWEYHRDRLGRGLDRLRIPCRPTDIQASIDTLLSRCSGDGVVKLTVTAGVGRRGYGISQPLSPTIVAQWLPGMNRMESARLALSPHRLPHNPALAGIKHLNRLDQVLAAAQAPAGFQPLLLDQAGRVVEALSHNIFALAGGRWLTPKLERCGVAGVMRSLLLERVFNDAGIDVSVADFGTDTLFSAAEVFICNSVSGVLPVTGVAGRETGYGQQQTRLISTRLAELYPCFPA